MEFAADDGQSLSADCPTLLLPALSIGNVGQLAIDLLISSIGAKRVGYLDEPSVLPCVGNDAYGPVPQGDLSLSLEAYESPSHGLALIQQRSPVIRGMMIQFAKNMINFIHSIGKNHVVILSSLDSGRSKRINASSEMQIYYISSSSDDGSDTECEKLGFKRLEEYDPAGNRWNYLNSLVECDSPKKQEEVLNYLCDDEEEEQELAYTEYFSSLPFAALFSCCKAKGVRVTCLLCYCSEGDNLSDAFQLAGAACKFLGSGGGEWVVPLSWNSVYGPPPDMTLF